MKKPISKKSKSADPRKKLSSEIRAVLDVYSKETDKKIKAQALDFQRYTGALSENFQHGLSAVAEQYSGLVEKVDGIKETLDDHGRILKMHTEMIGVMMEDVSVLKEDVAVLKEDVSVLKEDVAVLKEDVAVLKTDVSEIKDEFKTKADKTEVMHLSRRVSVLEHTS
jgi:chromosome segregation ATPase